MKLAKLQIENSIQKICLFWGIPLLDCNDIRFFRLTTIPTLPIKLTIFKNSKHSVSIAKDFRIVHYTSGSILIIPNLAFGLFDYFLYAPNEFDFFEIGKLCVLSALGILKENQGFSRLHAGFYQKDKSTHVVFGRSGSGKSTFVANLLKTASSDSKLIVYADELCFIKDSRIYPVPLHIHLKPHQFIPLNTFDQRVNFDLNSIYFLERSKQDSTIVPISSSECVKYFFLLLIGDGLHQMAAYHLRIRYLPHWCFVFMRRFFVFLKLLKQFRPNKQLVPDSNYLVRS